MQKALKYWCQVHTGYLFSSSGENTFLLCETSTNVEQNTSQKPHFTSTRIAPTKFTKFTKTYILKVEYNNSTLKLLNDDKLNSYLCNTFALRLDSSSGSSHIEVREKKESCMPQSCD